MVQAIDNFFLAWGAPEDQRDTLIAGAVSTDVSYDDPRGTVSGVEALCSYVAQFSANAPGAAAKVIEETGTGVTRRVRVRFYGDGWEQFGRYQVMLNEAGDICAISGLAEKSE